MPDARSDPGHAGARALAARGLRAVRRAGRVPLAAVTIIGTRGFKPAPGFLEIDMRAIGGSTAQLFWTSTWAFSENQSAVVGLTANPDDVERVRFPLPNHPLEFVRFDPIDGAGEVVIRQMRVTDAAGRTIRDDRSAGDVAAAPDRAVTGGR